ncbi:MAG TPA: hypothetical protein VFX39_04775, partial [Gemmatimonadaceae bacterium]|nr:hypothetical protein [Gemmatimonadaceae bacterium]
PGRRRVAGAVSGGVTVPGRAGATGTTVAAAVRRALASAKFAPAEHGGRRVRQLVQQPFVFEIR